MPCTINAGTEPGSYDDLTFTKNASTSKASLNSPVKKDEIAVIKVKVSAPNETPSGKVIFKKGVKKIGTDNLNAKGVAVLKIKALKVGKNKITTIYKGDGYTTGSKVVTTVKVTR